MPTEFSNLFADLIAFSMLGMGLILLGVLNFLVGERTSLRLGGSALILTTATAATALIVDVQPHAIWTGVGLLVGITLFSARFWGMTHTIANHLLSSTRRPAVSGGCALLTGLCVVAFALAKFDHDDHQMLEESTNFLEMVNARPILLPSEEHATTDNGSQIVVNYPVQPRSKAEIVPAEKHILSDLNFDDKTIRTQVANDYCNCHGWVFTGGRFWLDGGSVDSILRENDYVPVVEPKAGDVVIYREGTNVSHTAIVRYAQPGQPVLVEGKWGWMGVFLHGVEDSCYGKQFTYYRSPREGHLLVGMGGKPSPAHSVPVNNDVPLQHVD